MIFAWVVIDHFPKSSVGAKQAKRKEEKSWSGVVSDTNNGMARACVTTRKLSLRRTPGNGPAGAPVASALGGASEGALLVNDSKVRRRAGAFGVAGFVPFVNDGGEWKIESL